MFEHNPKALADIAREVEKAMTDRFDELARRYFPAHPHLQGVAASMAREVHVEGWNEGIASVEQARIHAKGWNDALEAAEQCAEDEPEPEGGMPDGMRGIDPAELVIGAVRSTKRCIAKTIRALKVENKT